LMLVEIVSSLHSRCMIIASIAFPVHVAKALG
jgi:hypothetical protein